MATVHDIIREAEHELDAAKRRALVLREQSKADKADRVLAFDVANAEADAAAAGRKLVEWRFRRDLWNLEDRYIRGEIQIDPLIAAMAPRGRGDNGKLAVDESWCFAMHLKRSGHAVPSDWRSDYSGEGLPNESDSRSVA